MQTSETVDQTASVVDAVEKLRAMGMAQYDRPVITRGKNKGQERVSQSPAQREAQNHLYREMAIVEARFIADKLGLYLDEEYQEKTGQFRMSMYPSYMGDLSWTDVDLIFQYFTKSGIMARPHNEATREERAARMAITFRQAAVWHVGGDIHIRAEALVA